MERIDRVDAERKHLENLLVNRINFYLVFTPVYLAGVYQIQIGPGMRLLALVVGTFISALLGLAIWRTHLLVQKALEEIGELAPRHPYIDYKRKISFPGNANKMLVWIPLIMTLFFATLTWHSLCAFLCRT